MRLFPDGAEGTAMAGFCGAIIYWITNRQSWKNGVVSLIVGVITAIYLTPAVSPILANVFGTTSELPSYLGGYVCGMSGIALNGLIMDILRGRLLYFRDAAKKESTDEQP